MRVTDLIAQDHHRVRGMFDELRRLGAGDGEVRRALFERIVEELDVHARAEEEVFYPAVRAASRRIDDAEAGHEYLRSIIAEVREREPSSAEFSHGVLLIERIVLSHVLEEESGIFMDAERMGAEELERLGVAMQERQAALKRSGRRAA